VVTVGNFDGVHRGHRALVERTVELARGRGLRSVVLTFEPHPLRVLAPERAAPALTTLAQKQELLAAHGVDTLAVLPFSRELAAMTAEEFTAGVLASSLRARHVVVGESFRFGRGQSGNVSSLTASGARLGFSVSAVRPVLDGELPVSSSRVREALGRGDVARARALLGRSYFVDGRVVAGDRRGRTLGIPTANLEPENELVPARGVYAGRVRTPDGRWRPAVVNRGRRPTFGGEAESVEAHLLDFDADIYDQVIEVRFRRWLRHEQRFDSIDRLVAQLANDVQQARVLLRT
jgi:riboflavin kinase/FMN adenylyltransferase